MTRTLLAAASVLVGVLAVAGCGGAAPTAAPAAPSSPTQPAPLSTPAPPVEPPPAVPQDELDEALRRAAWDNDVERAASLIGRGADVNATDSTVQSAYLIATSEGYLELLELTLAAGANLDAKDSFNGTGLIRAAERGHHLVAGRLLQAGIDRDHVNRSGYQGIHEAIWYGRDTPDYVATVRVLAAGGVELTRASTQEGLTPLQMAQRRGLPALGAAMDAALDPSAVTDPDAALLAAAGDGDADRAAQALRAGADLEARDPRARTPLLLAAAGDRIEVARLLVAAGADPDALDDRHDTPWLVTGVTGSAAMAAILLPARPDLRIYNRFGGTSLIPASERGHVDYVRAVVQTGVEIDHVNQLGWTALLEAVVYGDGGAPYQEIVRSLLDAGADRSLVDADGVTALEHAQRRGQTAVAALLAA